MSKLLDYLNHLDQNADARDAHFKDSESAAKDFGLTDDEHAALISGDKEKIASIIGVTADALPAIHTIVRAF